MSLLKITTPSASEDLTTLDAVKAELEIVVDDFDAQLAAFITQASDICADWCMTTFGLASYLETFFEGTSSDRLVLSRKPLVSVDSVTEADQLLVVDTDYVVDEDGGVLQRLPGNLQGWGWTGQRPYGLRSGWSQPKIVVAYQAGFALIGNLPPSVERACLELVKDYWFSRTRDPRINQINIPGVVERRYSASRGDVSTEAALPRSVTDLLHSFRRFPGSN